MAKAVDAWAVWCDSNDVVTWYYSTGQPFCWRVTDNGAGPGWVCLPPGAPVPAPAIVFTNLDAAKVYVEIEVANGN